MLDIVWAVNKMKEQHVSLNKRSDVHGRFVKPYKCNLNKFQIDFIGAGINMFHYDFQHIVYIDTACMHWHVIIKLELAILMENNVQVEVRTALPNWRQWIFSVYFFDVMRIKVRYLFVYCWYGWWRKSIIQMQHWFSNKHRNTKSFMEVPQNIPKFSQTTFM